MDPFEEAPAGRKLVSAYVYCGHAALQLESKLYTLLTPLLEPEKLLFPKSKAVMEHVFHITLAMKLDIATAIAVRQTYPAFRVALPQTRIVFLDRGVWHLPVPSSGGPLKLFPMKRHAKRRGNQRIERAVLEHRFALDSVINVCYTEREG